MHARILVSGDRDYTDIKNVEHGLMRAAAFLGYDDAFAAPITLVHGDCKRKLPDGRVDPTRSLDQLARQVALLLRWTVEPHAVTQAMKDEWGPYRAFTERNRIMVELGADLCVGFPGGKGTENCVKLAREAGIKVMEIAPASQPPLF